MNKALPSKRFEFLIHLAIWVGYSFLVFSGPIISKDFSSQTLILTARALIVNSILFYVNTFILLPKMVGKSKYLLYIITIVTLMAGSGLFYEVTEKWFKPYMEERAMSMPFDKMEYDKFSDAPDFNPRNQPPFSRDFNKIPRGAHLVFGFISTLGILFISTIFWVITESKHRQEREMALINENLTTEMKFLKSQINPHFLFNALNNIYSLSHTSSSKTPEDDPQIIGYAPVYALRK
ncbi:MAG: histidine kinase [Breznakibacter sp.]